MKLKALVPLALLSTLIACEQKEEMQAETATATTDLTSDADRFSYGLGMIVGERVLKQYDSVNYDLLIEGMKAQHQSQATLITIEDAGAVLAAHAQQQLETQTEANKMKGADYLAENARKEGVSVTESGLQYSVITQGDGARPGATDQVTVHYRGTLIDGTEFDSSYSRGEPATFGLNQVIPGWTEGVQLMNIGSKYLFVVPYELGYGERGAGGAIGPFETLIFEVELIEIKS
jgi:FKBP-type peptidyl-prolyl cis-trans isomerase